MNLIDHRILIPTSPERVWHFVGDLKRNSEWQANCRGISVLTSAPKTQPGTRLRITPDRGREYVIEISAWYERFGYEYNVVEGGSFRENKGTLRLQEVPEGTIVQWTFSFKPGFFNRGAGRALESMIIDSLRGLYRLITKSKEVETFQAKSLMRDDPGVEARATYRPRHPFGDTAEGSAGRVKGAPRQPTRPQTPVVFAEPPVKADDTKPRPVVVDAPAATAMPAEPVTIPPVPYTPSGQIIEPDFLIDEPHTPFVDVPSEPVTVPATEPAEASAPTADVTPAAPSAAEPTPVEAPTVEAPKAVEPIAPLVPVAVNEPPTQSTDTRQHTPAPPAPLEDTSQKTALDTSPMLVTYPTPSEVAVVKPASKPRRDRLTDTAKISVFDVFGLPKPSETQEIRAIRTDADGNPIPVELAVEAAPAAVVATTPSATPQQNGIPDARRYGKRALLRRQLVKVRQPI